MNKSIRAFFDERAANWDDMVCPQHAERLKTMVAALGLSDGGRVLDVGAGNGVLVPFLAAKARFVVELDISRRMLCEGRARSVGEKVAFLQADVLDLPIAPAAFDVVICNSCFPHFSDQRRAIAEMARVLDTGGRLVVCHTQSRECINTHHRRAGGTVGGHELPPDDEMRALVTGAGLSVAEFSNGPGGYCLIGRNQR
ncbi:MAG: methyltransferase domain-containing protein [Nitrospiraceae bacterium]|nr:methyltransferase domain-containing protein [Nitrospiraceae bacterium]